MGYFCLKGGGGGGGGLKHRFKQGLEIKTILNTTCGKGTNKDGAAANCFTNNIHH